MEQRPRVMVVEDVDDIKRLFDVVLRPVNAERVFVDNSETAHSALDERRIDVVVIEPLRPWCWEVHTAATAAAIPSIVVTSWVDPTFLDAAEAARASRVLTKPFTPDELRAAVSAVPVCAAVTV